ncbi:MAG: F0F1 ATP synthase subunit epsilon [Calditrichaeota bacterium]|nr:F0F1 ATP synthase subunit epsilon [Calditrichota bacterium]
MPRSFQLEIVTPTRVLDLGPVNYLRAPSMDGLFGIMARHTRAMISLEVGEIKVVKEGKPQYYATNGGYADIHGNSVQLLVETAEEAKEIDVDRAKSAAERARERLAVSMRKDIDEARAEIALKRAVSRLGIAGRRG